MFEQTGQWDQQMEYSRLAKRRGYTLLFLLLCMVCCPNAFGDPNPLVREFPLTPKLALLLLDRYELVADGEFHELPIYTPNESVSLRREDVQVSFRIDKLYRGKAHDSITVRFTNDMLMVPGEDESRYGKRRRILAKIWTELEPLQEQQETLERSYEAGEIDEREYRRERGRLNRRAAELFNKEGLHETRAGRAAIGRRSFYDNGGAIRPG